MSTDNPTQSQVDAFTGDTLPDADHLPKQGRNPIWTAVLLSIPLVLMSFYCFYGHSQEKLFALPMYLATLFIEGIYLTLLGRMVFKTHKTEMQALANWQKHVMMFSVGVQVVMLICVTVHYLRFPK